MRYALASLLAAAAATAGELTLPYKNQATPLWQGWIYDTGGYHGGIDYGCGCGTEVVAAADGYAISWYQPYNPRDPEDYSHGEYVLMYHPSIGRYTLYAHLSSWASYIPRRNRTVYKQNDGWVWVSRGMKVGTAGKTGTQVCHLHFELTRFGYSNGREDPYGIYGTVSYYPGCGSNTSPFYFTQCPPVVPGTTSCANPGAFVQISKAPDFDGNRRNDIARYYPAVGKWSVALSTGQDFLEFNQWTCGHGVGSSAQMVGDVNGDQLADAVVYFASNGSAYVALSTGSGFAGYYLATSTPVLQNCSRRWLEDVNGDGRTDLVGYVPSTGSWYVALSNGQQFVPQVHAIYGHGVGSSNQFLTYVNYDWRVDAVVYFAGTGSWYVSFGQPDGRFSPYSLFASGHGVGSTEQYMADINGDIMNEAICYWNSFGGGAPRVIAWNSNGSRFVQDNNPRTTGQSFNAAQRIFADFNGDYRADFGFWYQSAGWYVAVTDGYGFAWATNW